MTATLGDKLRALRELRDRDLFGRWAQEARALANQEPSSVLAQMEAASACESVGDEASAVRYYDAAWALGIPEAERPAFVTGYGATLRAVGRLDESVARLAEGLLEYPHYSPIKAFLALSLAASGHSQAALATALELVLELADGDQLDGFESALAQAQTELTRAAIEP